MNNFVTLLEESISSSLDMFTSFLRIVPNHHINDNSLKEYFYQGQDNNNKNYSKLSWEVLIVNTLMPIS